MKNPGYEFRYAALARAEALKMRESSKVGRIVCYAGYENVCQVEDEVARDFEEMADQIDAGLITDMENEAVEKLLDRWMENKRLERQSAQT